MASPVSSPTPFPLTDGISQVTGLSLVLVLLFVGGRIAANLHLHHKIFLDDFAALAGFGFFMAFTGLCFGIDRYARNGSWDATAPYFQKAVYAAEVIAPPASLTAKASVLLLYLRIFNPSVSLRRAVAILVGIVVVVSTPSLPLFSFYCAPNASDTAWDAEIAQNCLKASPWAAVLQVFDVTINIGILMLPMPSIFGLHLSLKRRLLLAFVLMHGVFGIAASIAGAIYRADLARTSDLTDALWFRSAAFVCFEVELGMTLVSGSMHACWGFIRLTASQRASRTASSGPNYYPSKERSGDGSDPKRGMAGASSSETAVSEGSSSPPDEMRSAAAGAGYRCSELGPGIRSTTQLHNLAATETTGDHKLPRTPPALQPGLQTVSPARSRGVSPLPPHTGGTRTLTPTPDLKSAFAAAGVASSASSPAPPSASELEDPSSPPGPRVVPTGRLMAEIEAAVAAAGKARLVVGTTRPQSGAEGSFVEGVDVQRVPPVPALPSPTGLPPPGGPPAVPHKETKAEVYRRSHIAITAGVQEGYREYVVEKVGDEYVVQKVSPSTSAAAPAKSESQTKAAANEWAGRGYSL